MKHDEFKYGIIVVDPAKTNDIDVEVLHFCGYQMPPTDQDAFNLKEELLSDKEFGLTEIAESLEYLEASPDIVKHFINLANNE